MWYTGSNICYPEPRAQWEAQSSGKGGKYI